MACRFGFIVAILTALLGVTPAKALTGGEATGIWLTQAGDAKVRVSKCGGGICGVVVWLREPIDPATGKPQVDDKNPNPALAKRPMIGLPLFSGMQPAGPNKWSGQIYNADDGNSYASNISVAGPDALRVEGCVGALCGGETWSRSARRAVMENDETSSSSSPGSGVFAASRRMGHGPHGSRRASRSSP